MTPAELKIARARFGLTAEAFAKLVRAGSGRTVRHWENGDRAIPGPVALIVELLQQSAIVRRMLLPKKVG
jgi:DNA-binding transcriptional regulator YiaG